MARWKLLEIDLEINQTNSLHAGSFSYKVFEKVECCEGFEPLDSWLKFVYTQDLWVIW